VATFIHSKLTVVFLDNAAGALQDISQYCNSVSFPQELEEVDTTSFGATSRTFIPGFAAGTLSLSGNWDRTFDGIMSGVYAAFRAGTLTSVTFEYGPEGNTAGDVRYTGEAVMLSYEKSSEVEDPVAWSSELRVSGTVTVNTY